VRRVDAGRLASKEQGRAEDSRAAHDTLISSLN
jgi:hypothetical protein